MTEKGVRYRLHGPPIDYPETWEDVEALLEGTPPHYSDGEKLWVAEELPRIPNWPQGLGAAPQFLSGDPDMPIKAGDLVLLRTGRAYFGGEDFCTRTIRAEEAGMTLHQYRTPGTTAYLIARTDLEEDI